MSVLIDNFYAGLFNKPATKGTRNPEGEVNFEGYERVQFSIYNGQSITEIIFPCALSECNKPVKYMLVLTGDNLVKDCIEL